MSGQIRGMLEADRRGFLVTGDKLVEIPANVERGTLSSSAGRVGMAWLQGQLVITDGPNGYVLKLADNTFSRITDVDWPGSPMVDVIDAWAVFAPSGGQQFYVSALNDASDLDALDVATSEALPDRIVGHIVSGRELFVFGDISTEIWYPSGDEFPLARRTVLDVGCVAPWSIARADNAVMFVSRDRNGHGMVGLISGYQYKRVSDFALEEALRASTDLASSAAFTLQWEGETYYVLQAPGLKTTPIYQASTGKWCDLADIDAQGNFKAFRATHHLFTGGEHYLGDATGRVHKMSHAAYTYSGDARVCERAAPSDAGPLMAKKRYDRFVLDCLTGKATESQAPMVQLSWSNDGGETFCDPVLRSAGLTGQYRLYPTWRRCGMSRDRVWRVRFSDAAPFHIFKAEWA